MALADPRWVASRGASLVETGQLERAIQDYDEAIRLDPQIAFAHFRRGDAYRNLGQPQRAIQDYDEAITIDSQDAKAYNNRGIASNTLRKGVHRGTKCK